MRLEIIYHKDTLSMGWVDADIFIGPEFCGELRIPAVLMALTTVETVIRPVDIIVKEK